MSTQGQTGTQVPTWVDGIRQDDLLEALRQGPGGGASSTDNRFWATPERAMGDETDEVLEVRFTGDRLVNYMAFQTAHFPHTVTAQWRDEDTKVWHTFQALPDIPVGQTASEVPTHDVRLSLFDSLPTKVNLASGSASSGHPQHTGARHWYPEVWSRIVPVEVRRIRLILQRLIGTAPTDARGNPVAYSLGIRNLQVGYRVDSRDDIPRRVVTDDADSFASTTDLLGSRVLFGIREQRARRAVDGNVESYWRSEPQPVNYAVVNFYMDMRKGFDSTVTGGVEAPTETVVYRPARTTGV